MAKRCIAVQVDRKSGAIVRDLLLFSPPEPAFCHPYNSYASCTPVIEPGRVYIHFGSYGTVAIDTASGKRLWTRQDLPCDHFRGPGSSPILWNNLLILTFDGADFQYLVAPRQKDRQHRLAQRSQHPLRLRRRRLSQGLFDAHGHQRGWQRATRQSQRRSDHRLRSGHRSASCGGCKAAA